MRYTTLLILSTFALLTVSPAAQAQVKTVVRASVATDGTQSNAASYCPQLSADGRYIAFSSLATNLIAGSTQSASGVYLRDTTSGTTIRVDTSSSGETANALVGFGGCDFSLSSSGTYVAFSSSATNLGGTGSGSQIYRKNTQTGVVEQVSKSSSGGFGNGSQNPIISSDGRYIAFASSASDLVSGDTNNANDIFVYDADTQTTVRASLTDDDQQTNGLSYSPEMSADGRYVLFSSSATNLGGGGLSIGLYLRDLQAGTTTKISLGSSNQLPTAVDLSPDGRFVIFVSAATDIVSNDSNGTADVFMYDTQTGQYELVSVNSEEVQASDISYLSILHSSISADNRFVSFGSIASNLINGDINGNFDIFVRDRTAGSTLIASIKPECLDSSESQNETSEGATISADGSKVAFLSISSSLVANDTNAVTDVFVASLIAPKALVGKTKLTDPPNPSVCSLQASITAPLFLKSLDGTALVRPNAVKNIYYDVRVSTKAKPDFKRLLNKRNSLATNLKPGNYSAKFRLVEKSGKKEKVLTKFSPKASFTVE